MVLITDPDDLVDGLNIIIDTTEKTVELTKAGVLDDDGVVIKAVYSKLKELWRDNIEYVKFPFPMIPITDEQFEIVNGWDWEGDDTRNLLRTGGWARVDVNGVTQEMYAGVISLGILGEEDQVYYQQEDGGSTQNIVLTGVVNQAVKIFDLGESEDFREYLKLFCREFGKTYAFAELQEIGVSRLTYQAYRFPLSNATDINIIADDSTVDSEAPYNGMSITWYETPQNRTLGATGTFPFSVIIDGNGGTTNQIYTFVQRELRRDTDIDAGSGTQIGNVTSNILRFVGDTLFTESLPEGGTFIDDFAVAFINSIEFMDDSGELRTFPLLTVLTVNFGANLVADTDAKYWIYFTSLPGDADYGTSDATIVRTADVFETVSRERSGNVATITLNEPHGLEEEQYVELIGVGGTGYNGQYKITSVTTNTISYANEGSDEGSTADTDGTAYVLMAGPIGGVSSKELPFDYDFNEQGGRTPASTAPITGVGIGLETSQFVSATSSIADVPSSISLVSALERNYENPE